MKIEKSIDLNAKETQEGISQNKAEDDLKPDQFMFYQSFRQIFIDSRPRMIVT